MTADDAVANQRHQAEVSAKSATLLGSTYHPTPEQLEDQRRHQRRYERKEAIELAIRAGAGYEAVSLAKQIMEFIEGAE